MHTEVGYRPVLADDHWGYQYDQHQSYNMHDDTFDHLPPLPAMMSQLGVCSPGHVAWRGALFPYSILGTNDSETQHPHDSET
jgi:hypothetical protein